MSWEEGEAPEGWTLSRLGDVVKVVGGGTPKTSVPGNFSESEGHPWITPADLTRYTDKYISRGRRFLTDQGLATSSAKYMPAGSVLFSTRAPIGYVAVAANPVTTNQGFRSFVPNGMVDSEYIYYALKFLRPLAEQLASGTTFAELSGSNAAKLPIAYPSLDKQRAIVRTLDTATEEGRTAKSHLSAARRAVDRFRQAVLTAACSGRLTSDWRDEDSDGDDLPSGWSWSTVGSLGAVKGGKRLPKGHQYSSEPTGLPYIRVTDFTDNHLVDTTSLKWLATETQEAIARYTISADDVYISIAGTIGMVGRIPSELNAANLTENAAKITDLHDVEPDYLVAWLASPGGRDAISRRITSSGQPKLALFRIAEIPVPLPTVLEQAEIVRRVHHLSAVVDRLNQRIDVASRRVEHSSQAVLAKAFRGELALEGIASNGQ